MTEQETARRLMAPAPVLDAAAGPDGLSEPTLDWPDGEYTARARRSPAEDGWASWTVEHSLSGADPILELIDSGSAGYSVEAVCGLTVWRRAFPSSPSSDPVTRVRVEHSNVRGDVFLYPRVVTTADCSVTCDPLVSDLLWSDGTAHVAPGRFLAIHRPIAVRADGKGERSPYVVKAHPDVMPGKMRGPRIVSRDGDNEFWIEVSEQDMPTVKSEAAEPYLLSAVFARLPSTKEWRIEREDGARIRVPLSRIGEDIAWELDAAEVPLWDEDGWDPMRAATHFVDIAPLNEEVET